MTPECLDGSAAAIRTALDSLLVARRLRRSRDSDERKFARAYEELADEDLQRALRLLVHHGAKADGLPHLDRVPSHLRDTAAARRLLAALGAAVEAAAAVDEERQMQWSDRRSGLLGYARGVGWAGTLAGLHQRIRIEVSGTHPTIGFTAAPEQVPAVAAVAAAAPPQVAPRS